MADTNREIETRKCAEVVAEAEARIATLSQ